MPDLVPLIDSEAEQSILEHSLSGTVPKDTLTTILTFTNGETFPVFIDGVRGQANADGEFFVFVNTVLKDSVRVTASHPTAQFPFPNKGQRLEPGDIMDVKAIHYLDVSADIRATIFGHANG